MFQRFVLNFRNVFLCMLCLKQKKVVKFDQPHDGPQLLEETRFILVSVALHND